jgi:DNA-binding transcriptional MerR regulator|tara:strand:- start:738 stop:1655 length:918 start_codon:yes stop_codon:yes gene_type:complete
MSIRNSNYGLSGILEGSTESEQQKERNARIKVSRQLGISLEEFEQQLQPKNLDQETPMDALLYVSYPKTKYNPADVAVKASVAVKDKFGNTAAEKKRMIDKHITRKPVYPFHTPKNIDFLTKTLKEGSIEKLTPREEKEINQLNKDLKRDALKSEIADVIPYSHHNRESYPSDPIQGARLKNIDALEKSLEGEKQSRVNAQLTKLKKFGKNPLVAEEKGSDFYFDPSTNQLELKSKPPELRPKLQAATKATTASAKYIPREQRIYESIKLQGYETPEKSDRSFAKLEADRALDDERSKRRNARFI